MKLNEIGLKDSTSILAQKSVLLESPVAGVTPRVMETSRNIYFMASKTDVFRFDLDDDGRRQARELERAWRQRSARARLRQSFNAYKVSTPSAGRITNASQITQSRLPRTFRILSSPASRAFFKFLLYWGVTQALTNSLLVNIANYEEDFNNGVIDETEFQDRVQVAYGVWSIEIAAIILVLVKQGTKAIIRILKNIRTAVRAVSVRGLFTGVGTIPSLMALVGSQIAVASVAYLFTRPAVQNKFVDWIIEWGQSSVIGSIFQSGVEGAGTAMQAASAALDAVTGGLLGSDNLFASIGAAEAMGGDAYTKSRTEIPGLEGSAFASQEWAKLVFQDLLFPPGTSIEDKLVPYMDYEQRENRLSETFGKVEQQAEDPDANDPRGKNQIPPVPSGTPTLTPRLDTKGETPARPAAELSRRTREQSLQNTDYYNNPSYTRAQPVSGPR